MMGRTDARDGRRGQLVLVAAIALAVALVPLGIAYLQLGYHEDTDAGTTAAPAPQITGTLDRSLHAATANTAHADWENRTRTATALRTGLEPAIETVRTARLAEGHVYAVAYNQTRAERWHRRNCPGGPDRQFGSCDAIDGVVVQERGGQTYVLGVAVDIRITTPSGETTLTTVRRLDYVT